MMEESTKFQESDSKSMDDAPIDFGVNDIFGNVHVGEDLYLNKDVYERLYGYQKKALLWFWDLHRKKKGGILGDDMGLGKTIQVIAFLRSLTETRLSLKLRVLLVLPVTLIENWMREFKDWAPKMCLYKLHGQSMNERKRLLNQVQKTGGVLLTSYGLVRTCWHELSHNKEGRTSVWDYMICDEGHRIKNPAAQTTKAAHGITASHRFILTGTPIQNNLMEFWTLFSFVEGSILGQQQTFRREYETPITNSRKKEASEELKAKGNALSESLRRLTDPYFLHRRKADVLKKKEVKEGNEEGQENEGMEKNEKTQGNERAPEDERAQEEEELPSCSYWKMDSHPPMNRTRSLTHKNDLVMWLPPSPTQIYFYNQYVNLDFFKEVMRENDKRCVFVELMILKALCDHPRLLSKRACRMLGLIQEPRDGSEEDASEMECAANDITGVSEEVLMEESGKLEFLFKLLENLREEGHRCLVFSRSLKMLNMIEKILRTRQFRWKRLDGSIRDMIEREAIIQDFQEDNSYNLFLLTTQVGGTGLNLTGADRVVIIDPSWNPSTDNQAVDRAYRIGQTKPVIVYRLITCGTIEEKIYRRQVFKESLIKQTMGNSEEDTYRYFTSQELRHLFQLEDTDVSVTQKQLEGLHAWQRKSWRELDQHIAFLKTIVSGISDHDLLFSLDCKTLRAKLAEYDAEVRLAEGELAADNKHNLHREDWPIRPQGSRDLKPLLLPNKQHQSINGAVGNMKTWFMTNTRVKKKEEEKKDVKFGIKKEERSILLQQVPERRLAIPGSVPDAAPCTVKIENQLDRCSIKIEKKPTLKEIPSLPNQHLGWATRDSKPATAVRTSPDEYLGIFPNGSKTSNVKKEETSSDCTKKASRMLEELSGRFGFDDGFGKTEQDNSSCSCESLEIVEWMPSKSKPDTVQGVEAPDSVDDVQNPSCSQSEETIRAVVPISQGILGKFDAGYVVCRHDSLEDRDRVLSQGEHGDAAPDKDNAVKDKVTDQSNSACEPSRTLKEKNISSFHGDPGKFDTEIPECSDESLEKIEWMCSQGGDDRPDAQDTETEKARRHSDCTKTSSGVLKENVVPCFPSTSEKVKQEDMKCKVEYPQKVEPNSLKRVHKVCFLDATPDDDDDACSDTSSIICLEEPSDNNLKPGTACQSERMVFKQEEVEEVEASLPKKKARSEDCKFVWLDR